MKRFAILLLGWFVFVPGALASVSANDAEVILNRLLKIDNKAFLVKNTDGGTRYDSLKEYKEWESIYIKYSKYDLKDKAFSISDLKKLLFLGMVTKINHDAAISESFASDLIPIYIANKENMFTIMKDLPFLIPSTCYYLNSYFGFEGKNRDKKSDFLNNNRNILEKLLGAKKAQECLEYFE